MSDLPREAEAILRQLAQGEVTQEQLVGSLKEVRKVSLDTYLDLQLDLTLDLITESLARIAGLDERVAAIEQRLGIER